MIAIDNQHWQLAEGYLHLGLGPWHAEMIPCHLISVGQPCMMHQHLRCLAKGAQIVLCGKQATDSDNHQMAATLAAILPVD